MDSIWHIIVTSTPQIAAAGLKYTIPIAIISFILGLILAIFTALVKISTRRGWFLILKAIANFYVWLFRSTPLLVQLFIVYFGLPYLKIKGLFPNGVQLDPWTAGIATFSLNTGAYCAETIRAAILSIPQGQWEAAYSIGMTKSQVLKRIILPQAARVSLPPLSNSFISLVKDTPWPLQSRLLKCSKSANKLLLKIINHLWCTPWLLPYTQFYVRFSAGYKATWKSGRHVTYGHLIRRLSNDQIRTLK